MVMLCKMVFWVKLFSGGIKLSFIILILICNGRRGPVLPSPDQSRWLHRATAGIWICGRGRQHTRRIVIIVKLGGQIYKIYHILYLLNLSTKVFTIFTISGGNAHLTYLFLNIPRSLAIYWRPNAECHDWNESFVAAFLAWLNCALVQTGITPHILEKIQRKSFQRS